MAIPGKSGRDELSYRRSMDALLDDIDESRAAKLRGELGRKKWIVSWTRLGPRRWLARLSGPGCDETVERSGRTRVEAIEMAKIVLQTCIDELD